MVEETGRFGEVDEMLYINLPEKPKGGRRPISWYTTMYRLWGKVRKPDQREWVRRHMNARCYNAGQHKKTTDSVWRAEVRAEGATHRSHHYAMLFSGLQQAYNTIDHQRLVEEAKACNYNMKIMRVQIKAYRWKRLLLLGVILAEEVWLQKSLGQDVGEHWTASKYSWQGP